MFSHFRFSVTFVLSVMMNCYAVTQCSTHNHVALCCYAMCRIKIPSEDNSYDIKLLLDVRAIVNGG